MIEELLSTKQVAKILGLQPKTLSNARSSGVGITIPFLKLGGGVVRYKRSELESYLDANSYNHNGEVKSLDAAEEPNGF